MPPVPFPREDAGLKTINKRLAELEEELENEKGNTLFTKLKRADKERKKAELEKLYQSFTESFVGTDVVLDEDNLVGIIIHTLNYVRQNVINISRLAGAKPSSEFEKLCTCSFVEDILPDMSKTLINRCVEVLHPIYPIKYKPIPEDTSTSLAVVPRRTSKFKLF